MKEVGLSRGPGQSKIDEGEVPGLTVCLVLLGEEGGEGADRLGGKGSKVGRLARGSRGRGGRGGQRPPKLEDMGVEGS